MNPLIDGEPQNDVRPPPAATPHAVEVAMFLFLILPSMLISLVAIDKIRIPFLLLALSIIMRDLGLSALVLYLTWRNGESWQKLGWRFAHVGREAAIGMVLFVPFFIGAIALENALRTAGLSGPSAHKPSLLVPATPFDLALATLMVFVVAIAEETIFRGYLMLRLVAVTRRPLLSAVLSSLIFSLGHGYEGLSGAITVGFMGLAFALIYLWRGTLIAPVIMHFLQNFISVVVVSIAAR